MSNKETPLIIICYEDIDYDERGVFCWKIIIDSRFTTIVTECMRIQVLMLPADVIMIPDVPVIRTERILMICLLRWRMCRGRTGVRFMNLVRL